MSTLSTPSRRRALVLGGLGAGMLALAAFTWSATHHLSTYFVNGLDVPVQVSAGGERFELPPGEHRMRRLRPGLLEVDVRAGDRPVAHDSVYVDDDAGVLVYNVLGAAPLFRNQVVYSHRAAGDQPAPEPTLLAGTPFLDVGRIDHVFTEPPRTISVDGKHEGDTVRTVLGLAPYGWKSTLQWLVSLDRFADAGRVAQAVLRATPQVPEVELAASVAALALERTEGRLAALAFARTWRDAHPDDYSAHRMWVHELRRTGRIAEARAHYAAALARTPDSQLLATLLARAEPGPEATARLEAFLRAHPGAQLPRRGLTLRYVRERRWPEALALLEQLEQHDPEYPAFADTHAQALVALGRREEAARRLAERMQKGEHVRWADLLLLAQLLPPEWEASQRKAFDALVARALEGTSEPQLRAWLATSLGTPLEKKQPHGPPSDLAAALPLLDSLLAGPEAAAPVWARAPASAFTRVGDTAGLLMAAELERLGDGALAAHTLDTMMGLALTYEELQDVVWGRRSPESLDALDPEERAALHLVVARRLDAQGQDAGEAYALARRSAPLPGPVLAALARWPRPTHRAPRLAGAAAP